MRIDRGLLQVRVFNVPFALAALLAACTRPSHQSLPARFAQVPVACPMARGDCDGDPANGCETDLSSDPANCRACGHGCVGVHVDVALCVDGRCEVLDCEPGFGDCDGQAENGCEGLICHHSHGDECEIGECRDSSYEF